MFIDTKTQLFGIFGHPLSHSLSPRLHSFMFKQLDVNAVYLAFETDNVEESLRAVKTLNIQGVNITIPYKEIAFKLVDIIDPDADVVGAINTIKNNNGVLYGYNTDYLGFMDMVKLNIDNYKNKRFVVLGAGGAAKAIVYGLYKLGLSNIGLLNRTIDKAKLIQAQFKNYVNINIGNLNDSTALLSSDVIINCTPVGLNDNQTPIDIKYIDKKEVLDIIYKDSALILKAKKRGCKAVNGMDMFIGQAFYSFKIWTGLEFDRQLAYKLLKGNLIL